ncbi:hypothetical protein [Sphaerisporangium sp. TRM90804]|uniref:hypothetical protein n=1 Tax=Sphaerisporangium sp. TRM90804 TaxID=3031113 RepID=UPI002446A5E6|nr:hypothetical protein [Sphaerisporangium sp. TRM90804]MDH2423910.1 hypothetical protein [Sphaerisporangium sp. TRM90804]
MGLFTAGTAAGLVTVLVFAGAAAPAVARTAPPGGWGGADLSVSVAASPPVAQPGQWLSYRVEVRNSGPGDAVMPVLTVRVPGEVDIVDVDVSSCHPGTSRRVVVCPSASDIRPGDAGFLTVVGVVRTAARGPLHAVARLSSEVVDDNEADNRAEVVTRVDEGADLAVRLSRPAGGAGPGRRLTVRASVRNSGPRTVRDGRLDLTAGKARLLTARGARCRARRGAVGCALRPIRPGADGTLSLDFRMPSRGTSEVKAEVYSVHLGDRRPANNRVSLRVAP